jgi:hypothetical protein
MLDPESPAPGRGSWEERRRDDRENWETMMIKFINLSSEISSLELHFVRQVNKRFPYMCSNLRATDLCGNTPKGELPMKRCTAKDTYAKSNEMARQQGTISPEAVSLFSQSSSRATHVCPDSEDDSESGLYSPNVDVDVSCNQAGSPGEETQGSMRPENAGGNIRASSPLVNLAARRAATSDIAATHPSRGASPAAEPLFSNVGRFSLEADTESGQQCPREPGQDRNSSGDDDDSNSEGTSTYNALDAESEEVLQHGQGENLANKYDIMKIPGSHFHGKPPPSIRPPRGRVRRSSRLTVPLGTICSL